MFKYQVLVAVTQTLPALFLLFPKSRFHLHGIYQSHFAGEEAKREVKRFAEVKARGEAVVESRSL